MSGFDELKNYVEIDTQKFRLIEDLLNSSKMEMQILQCKELEMPFDFDENCVESAVHLRKSVHLNSVQSSCT